MIDAAIDSGVSRVVALSTDKAVNPVNLYGATKLAAEKLFVQSNAYAGGREVRFACVRYGNVVGSRGSVVPVFLKQRETGKVTVTDDRMTRFWISLEQGVRFVIRAAETMYGGEVFVPKIPSCTVADLARAIAPEAKIEIIGIRPGEKLHEVLISEDEARQTVEMPDMYVVQPAEALWFGRDWETKGRLLKDDFRYASNTNTQWLDVEQIKQDHCSHRSGLPGRKTLMSRFLVTGASGLLGLNFALAVDGKHHQVTGVDNRNPLGWVNFKTRQADLTEPGIIERLLEEIKPEVILHCAAMANVDDCEKRPADAERVNALLPGEIARNSKKT